jgi:predicted SnoaL-like aldol condensation-catalyzing enzyme
MDAPNFVSIIIQLMNRTNKQLISHFIETIWNQQQFNELDSFLHPDYQDFSLPPSLPENKEGLKSWILGTGVSFEHKTIVEEMVCEGDKVMVKFKMLLKHIGTWRDIEPTGADIHAVGYRYFTISNNQIIGHWALVDGNAIENQLKEASHGCKIQR